MRRPFTGSLLRRFIEDQIDSRTRSVRSRAWQFAVAAAAGLALTDDAQEGIAAFLAKRCGYLDIVRTIEHALEEATFVARPTLDDYAASDAEARRIAREFLKI